MPPFNDPIAELFEEAPCGLLLASPRGEVLAVNRTLLAWLGRSREEVVGKLSFSRLMNVAGRIYFETHIAPLLRMQGFVSEIAVELVRADGSNVPVFISATEARDESGAPRAVRIAVYPAAERRKYERELLLARQMAEQGLKAKSDFLAAFAHEVRNGLNAVSLAGVMLGKLPLPASAKRPLDLLRNALGRVIALMQNMLDFSRVEAGRIELASEPFDLRELLNGVAQTIMPAAERKGVAVHVDIGAGCPQHLIGDAVKIGQVVANLAGNAVKFTERGAVTIRAEQVRTQNRSATVRIEVRDTGIGIAPDRIAQIWDAYGQAGPEITARYGGTGLGLAISRRIVALHQSRIEVESRPGSGTRFWFDLTLPVAAAPVELSPRA